MRYKESEFGIIPEHWDIQSTFEYCKIITDYVANGSFKSLAENVNYNQGEKYAVLIRLTDYHNGFQGEFVHIDKQAYEFLGKTKLYGEEIIIANVGANVGTVFLVPNLKRKMSLGPNSIMIKTNGNDKFYYYWFKSRIGQGSLQSIITGSAQPKFNKTAFRKLNIPVPPINEQKAIANILSSLDDKIELNNKINKNLEELAQTIYKRWFVDFEFLNEDGEPYKSSGGEMVDSELGLIPKGWKISHLGVDDFSNLIGSGIDAFEGAKKYIATADVTNSTITSFETEISYEDRPSRANMQPISNSLWFAKMKDSRKLIRVSKYSDYLIKKCIFSTGFAGLICNNSLNYLWSFLLTKDFDDIKNNLCNGTTMQAINNSNINKIKIIIPDKNTLKNFEILTENLFSIIECKEKENKELSKLRDILLPKLMSGEIEVPNE